MELDLAGKVAIVTGASRGLGSAIVRALVGEGVRVVAAARSEPELLALAREHPDAVHPQVCDMADTDGVAALVDVAAGTFGDLHIVVNNAGIAPASPFAEMALETWQRVFAVNVLAPVALTRAAGARFVQRGSGKVVNVASTSGLRGKPLLAAYSASKGALLRFTEAVAGEWAGRGVQVNAIAPGAFATDAQRSVLDDPAVLARRLRKIPAGRMGDVGEIGALTCYLASPVSAFVTGAVFVIDGGEAAKL